MKKLFFALCFLHLSCEVVAQRKLTLQPDAAKGKDANIVDYYANDNLGTATYIHIARWTHDSFPSKERALIEFDLSGLPANSTIVSATLYLYADYLTPGVPAHRLVTSNSSSVQRIITPWNEQTVTWNNKPDVTSVHAQTIPATNEVTTNYSIDVKLLIEDMLADPAHSFGFMLSLIEEIALYNCLNFFSSDSPQANKRPRLEILYTTPEDALINVYELITPNQDGKNDYFWVAGINYYPQHEISIYNQWGNLVFHSTHYNNDWDGGALTGGMYYYVVTINGQTLTGNVYLDK